MRLLTVVILASIVGMFNPFDAWAQNGPPNGERYLIILKPQKNGVPELTDHDIAVAGGKVDFRAEGRVDVTLPAPALEALRKHGRVKYIQKAVIGPPPPPAAASVVRLKPTAMSLHPKADATPPTWLSGTYLYDKSGNIYAIGVAGDTGAPPQHRYAYDNLSRLTTATTTATLQPNETFGYDDYGNMTSHQVGTSTTTMSVVPATNRFVTGAPSPYQYDELGNLAADAEAIYAYDPFSMLREKDYQLKMPEFYIYTASDERIGVKYSSASNSVTTWSIRDFSGNVLRQFKGMDDQPFATWLWVEDYIYRDGQLLGAERVPEEGGRRHFHLDHLGSPRLVTSSETSSNEMSEHDFAPFGMEINPLWQETTGGFDREDPKRFTGHERDYASDGQLQTTKYLDYMHARFYSPGIGRFLSVDPIPGTRLRPQSWNRYAYGLNNPMNTTDPTGRVPCKVTSPKINGGKPFDSDCTTVVPKAPKTAAKPHMDWGGFKHFVDHSAFRFFTYSGGGNVMAGLYNDSASQVGKGSLQLVGTALSFGAAGKSISTIMRMATNNTVKPESFFDGAEFDIQGPNHLDEFHNFPDSVTAFEDEGTMTTFTGGDGRQYHMLEIEGGYGSYEGVFRFIKNDSNTITEATFFKH